jgi:hypothetical protein
MHSREEGVDNVNTAGMFLTTRGRYYIIKQLDFTAHLRFLFRSGRAQSTRLERWDTDKIYFREFLVNVKPMDHLHISLGAVGQDYLRAPFLVDAKFAFPGIRERLYFSNKRWGVELIAQQVIPTSTSLGVERTAKEPMPYFFTETLALGLFPIDTLELRVLATRYQFQNLPSVVAFRSYNYGNVLKEGGGLQSNSELRYPFSGWVMKLEGEWTWQTWSHLTLGTYTIENLESPANTNRGQHIYGKWDVMFGETILSPRYEVFFNEAHTSPAYYIEDRFGGANRQGHLMGVELSFRDLGFKLGSHYVRADVINKHPLQNVLNDFYFGVETLNVSF